MEREINELPQFIEVGKQRLAGFPSRREVCARAFEEEEKKCVALERRLRSLAEPY